MIAERFKRWKRPLRCPECGDHVVVDYERGELVCPSCSLVLDDLVVFSPPYYGLRDYGEGAETAWSEGWKGQLGLEPSWRMYVDHMVEVCREIKYVLKKTGSMYIVIGDTYYTGAGRSVNPGDDSKRGLDHLTQTYEHIFHFVKSRRYYNLDMVREPHRSAAGSGARGGARLRPTSGATSPTTASAPR